MPFEPSLNHLSRMRMPLGAGLLLAITSPWISQASEGTPPARTFEVTYRATVRDIPQGTRTLDLWLPLPQTDRNQTIHRVKVDAPGPRAVSFSDRG